MVQSKNKVDELAFYSKLRFRATNSNRNISDVLPNTYNERKRYIPKNLLPIPLHHFVFFLCLLIATYLAIFLYDKQLPTPLYMKDEPLNKGRFIAERARNLLANLTHLGPRTVGSFANEVLAISLLTREIHGIMHRASRSHRIMLDVQKVSGAFPLTFLDGMTNVYKNVQNVIVKIGPHVDLGHSLLVNCHFDSVVDSPGGSDDGASCAVMLEILRVISLNETPLKHNIIFLFNGAEENFLQASHGFITQHKWAKSVRAFINLEACGAGGKEILFQAGPEHPWLVEAYSESVPYPLASSLAQEVFQSGLIPGDTDYRIFRDFGHISGLDFAWATNGYVYHTKLDNIHQIPLGTLQRTGDNIHSLILKLVNSEEISNVDLYSKGNLVFFDFLGAFILYGREITAAVINICIVLFSVYTVLTNAKNAQLRGEYRKDAYLKTVTIIAAITVAYWVVTLLGITTIAFTITMLNRGLSWYSRQIWILFLYAIPSFVLPAYLLLKSGNKMSSAYSVWLKYQLYSDGNKLVFILASALLILFRIRSGFIVSLWLFFLSINWILTEKVLTNFRNYRYLWLHVACTIVPLVISCYMINAVVQLVVPIMGRSGSGNHAELVLAFIMSTLLVLLLSAYVPLILLVQDGKHLLKGMIAVFGVSVLILLLTPLGFPYSGDLQSPSPQRFIVIHMERVFHDIYGNVRANKTGLWLVNMDINSPRSVSTLIPDISRAEPIVQDCENELYCGLTYSVPVMSIMWQTHWIPGPRPEIPSPVHLNMTYRDYRLDNIQRFSFTAIGPDHMTLYLSPYKGVDVKGWSFVLGPPLKGPAWKGQPVYYVYYSYGSDPEPWNFWVDVQLQNSSYTGPVLEVGLSGYFMHGPYQTTPYLKKFFSQFPSWTTTSGWTSAYRSYTF